MLTNTFCHMRGIAEKTERKLWSAGIMSWDSDLPRADVRLPYAVLSSWYSGVKESIANRSNPRYFADRLPPREHWRLFSDFQDATAFLDIETTGLYGGEITTIAMYDGKTIRYYVNGENLAEFCDDVTAYRMLVTYNGKSFDAPFIERFFRIRLQHVHLDLRYPLGSLGLKGGLKGCERQLNISRTGMEDVSGLVAPLLWNEYSQRKNVKALETLLAYNIQDTLSLHALVVHMYNEKVKSTPFAASRTLPLPAIPQPPFEADRDTVEAVMRQAYAPWCANGISVPHGVATVGRIRAGEEA